jgi:AraC-like DNA-binding protein
MHTIQKQYTYNRSLYASPRDWHARRCRTLFAGDGVTIADHDAGASGQPHSLEPTSAGHRLIVTRRGAALLRRGAARGPALAAEALQAIVLEPGMAYVLEPVDAAHSFTVFTFRRELSSSIVPCAGGTSVVAPIASHALLDSRLLMSFHRLRRALGAAGASIEHSRSSVEDNALALLRAVCDGDRARGVTATCPAEPRQLLADRRRGEIVEQIKCILASAPEAPHALNSLSAALGISTSLLAHVFPQETGLSPHRYLLHLRSALALTELSAGANDLSRLALELGFATHSHFSAAFRRCTGMPPSEARLALAARDASTRPPVALNTPLLRCAYV